MEKEVRNTFVLLCARKVGESVFKILICRVKV